MLLYYPLLTAFWPRLYPVGLLPWSKSSDHITLGTKPHIPGATTTQCWYVTKIKYSYRHLFVFLRVVKEYTADMWNVPLFLHLCSSCAVGPKCDMSYR